MSLVGGDLKGGQSSLFTPSQHGHPVVVVVFQSIGAGVDVRFGGLRAEADADDAARCLFGQLQGGRHMAGLARVAGGAGGDV